MNDFHQILGKALSDALFAATAQIANAAIQRSEPSHIKHGRGETQSSFELAKTYALRRSIGYFDKKSVYGLDETITGLGIADRPVRLLYAEIGTALISVWFEDRNQTVAGLLVVQPSE